VTVRLNRTRDHELAISVFQTKSSTDLPGDGPMALPLHDFHQVMKI
jgi:hypothetical protein